MTTQPYYTPLCVIDKLLIDPQSMYTVGKTDLLTKASAEIAASKN